MYHFGVNTKIFRFKIIHHINQNFLQGKQLNINQINCMNYDANILIVVGKKYIQIKNQNLLRIAKPSKQ